MSSRAHTAVGRGTTATSRDRRATDSAPSSETLVMCRSPLVGMVPRRTGSLETMATRPGVREERGAADLRFEAVNLLGVAMDLKGIAARLTRNAAKSASRFTSARPPPSPCAGPRSRPSPPRAAARRRDRPRSTAVTRPATSRNRTRRRRRTRRTRSRGKGRSLVENVALPEHAPRFEERGGGTSAAGRCEAPCSRTSLFCQAFEAPCTASAKDEDMVSWQVNWPGKLLAGSWVKWTCLSSPIAQLLQDAGRRGGSMNIEGPARRRAGAGAALSEARLPGTDREVTDERAPARRTGTHHGGWAAGRREPGASRTRRELPGRSRRHPPHRFFGRNSRLRRLASPAERRKYAKISCSKTVREAPGASGKLLERAVSLPRSVRGAFRRRQKCVGASPRHLCPGMTSAGTDWVGGSTGPLHA